MRNGFCGCPILSVVAKGVVSLSCLEERRVDACRGALVRRAGFLTLVFALCASRCFVSGRVSIFDFRVLAQGTKGWVSPPPQRLLSVPIHLAFRTCQVQAQHIALEFHRSLVGPAKCPGKLTTNRSAQ